MALSGWRVKNYCQDNARKSLGPVVYEKRVPRAGKKLAGSPGYMSNKLESDEFVGTQSSTSRSTRERDG